MLITIILIGAVAVLGWPLVSRSMPKGGGQAAAPSGADRRMRWVERHPGEANTGDIERLLSAAGLSLHDARLVSEKSFALHIRPFTMWMFLKTYGARELAVAVVAEVPHEVLLEHLADGTLPDFGELEVFAGINGLQAAGRPEASPDADRGGRIFADAADEDDDVAATRSPEDLEIFEPGDWDGVPDNLTSFELPSDEPVADMDFGDWESGGGRVA